MDHQPPPLPPPPPPPPPPNHDFVDLDEEEEDVEHEIHPPEHDNNAVEDMEVENFHFYPDGSIDGGVAHPPSDERGGDSVAAVVAQRLASECDLMLYLECVEPLENIAPHHPVLRPTVTVAVGLDKLTKLSAVFTRYIDFCNEHAGADSVQIELGDLEFIHCQLLKGDDTAEASALMKNDRIRVRRNRENERIAEAEQNRLQRESDREYFKRLRLLLPESSLNWSCDLVLDCRGKLVDESGRSQEVLRSTVRAHSTILMARCKWLGHYIQVARDERERRSIVTIPEQAEEDKDESNDDINISNTPTTHDSDVVTERNDASVVAVKSRSDDGSIEDDEIGVLHLAIDRNQQPLDRSGAAEIENDEEDESPYKLTSFHQSVIHDLDDCPVESPILSSSGSGNELWITMPNHSPHAIRLLLEYCYTNRVISLGQEAFALSSRSKTESKHKGPVPPYTMGSSGTRRWPDNGAPQISFGVALSGIVLAEEAGMPRLSLMCEIAASQLVSNVHDVVDALLLSTTQQQRTGNALPCLRKAAMELVLRGGAKGGLTDTPSFRRALEEKSAILVPSLLRGTMEVVTALGKRKRDGDTSTTSPVAATALAALTDNSHHYFQRVDREDSQKRDLERRKRRIIKWDDHINNDSDQSSNSRGGVGDMGDYYGDDVSYSAEGLGSYHHPRTVDWALKEATLRSMKRLNSGRSTSAAADHLAATLSRYGFGNSGGSGAISGNRLGNALERLSGPFRRSGS